MNNDRITRPLLAALLCMAGGAVEAQTSELFFSEYIEGSSNNKAVEIYNGTGASVDLSTYSVQLFSNGAVTATATLSLSGTLANGDVYVIANTSSVAGITAVADVLAPTSGATAVTNFNGDDAVALLKSGNVLDVIGQIGFDPGTVWGTPPASTLNNTITRKSTVCAGDANGSNAFDPAGEWDGFAIDTISNLGSHTANCVTTPTISINDVSQAEGNSGTTNFAFTVSLSSPAPAGGVSFDINSADGTATLADND